MGPIRGAAWIRLYFLMVDVQQLSRKSGLLVTFTPMSELRDCMVPRLPKQNRKIEEETRKIPIRNRGKRACGASACLEESSGAWSLVFRATGRTFPWHAMTRFPGGERGCTGQQFENATPGNCYHLTAWAAFLCSTKVCAWWQLTHVLPFMNGSDFSCGTWSLWQVSHVLNAGVPAKSGAVVSPWHTVHSTPLAACGLAFHWS